MIDSLNNVWVRRLVLVLTAPLLLAIAVLIGVVEGLCQAVAEVGAVCVEGWRG